MAFLMSVVGAADSPLSVPAAGATAAAVDTPLHLAVLRGDADAVDALLAAGADATAVNAAGATPLHYAASSERMVTALLAHGAPVNAVSKIEVTPLLAAAVLPDSFAVVRRLVEAGADINQKGKNPIGGPVTVLNAAIAAGDRRTVELLLDRGAAANPTDLGFALLGASFGGDIEIVKLLLARGANVNGPDIPGGAQPLSRALFSGFGDIARLLIEHGADVHATAPLASAPTTMMLAAYNDACDPAVAQLLVERGADINSTDNNGETALSFALKRGSDNPLVTYLRAAGAKDSAVPRRAKAIPARAVPAEPTAREAMIRTSVQRAIDLIQPSSKIFLQTPRVRDQQKCTSCHHQDLPGTAMSLARERGLHVDEHELGRALHARVKEFSAQSEFARQTRLPFTLIIGYAFDFLHAYEFSPSDVTEAISRSLLALQRPDGSWSGPVRRPPMEDGDLVTTAWAARALQLYPPAARSGDAALALERARSWLASQNLRNLNDRIFQLLGIAWSGETAEHMRSLAEQLIAVQSSDGSWAQFPTLDGDAWATGAALVALHKAGIPAAHPAYQRGVAFLLSTQFEDGSWWVRSRSLPTQLHFNGGFPHGKDQWISAAGTAWAMIALLYTLEPTVDRGEFKRAEELIAAFEASPPEKTSKDAVAATESPPSSAPVATSIDFARDIQPLLERSCVGCHSGERPKGRFNLTARGSLLRGGQSGNPAVVPGYANDSQLLDYVSGRVEDLEMPPLHRRDKYPALSAEEIHRLRSWIDEGAPWPDGTPVAADGSSAPASPAIAAEPFADTARRRPAVRKE